MKKLYKNIAYFLAPIIILLIFLPVDTQLKFTGLKDDCFQHGQWIYNRIYKQSKAVDLAFIGSSHTLNGIDDRLIEEQLIKHKLKVTNFGYCRLGRNFSYMLLKEILRKKQPKIVVLEVREDEDRYSHPIFPHLANTRDVLLPQPFFNKDIASDLQTHLTYKVELSQDYLYENPIEDQANVSAFGYAPLNDTADLSAVITPEAINFDPHSLERKFYMQYPRAYLAKIRKLCASRQIKLYFLYLPGYHSPYERPKEMATYSTYGTVLIPPKELLADPHKWFDKGHVNAAGARELSLWIAGELARSSWQGGSLQ